MQCVYGQDKVEAGRQAGEARGSFGARTSADAGRMNERTRTRTKMRDKSSMCSDGAMQCFLTETTGKTRGDGIGDGRDEDEEKRNAKTRSTRGSGLTELTEIRGREAIRLADRLLCNKGGIDRYAG